VRALALASLFALVLAAPAVGQVAVTGGGAKEYFRAPGSSEFVELGSPLAGFAYDIVGNDSGTWGYSFGYRATGATVEGADIGIISQYLGEYWDSSGVLEWFIGAQGESWSPDVTSASTRFLGGPRLGIRFEAAGLPIELSGNISWGRDSIQRRGIVFGLRLVNASDEV